MVCYMGLVWNGRVWLGTVEQPQYCWVVGWFECVKLGQVRASEQAAPNRQHGTDMAAPPFTANRTKTKSCPEVRMDAAQQSLLSSNSRLL